MFYAIDCEQNESNNELMCEDSFFLVFLGFFMSCSDRIVHVLSRRIIHVLTWVLSW